MATSVMYILLRREFCCCLRRLLLCECACADGASPPGGNYPVRSSADTHGVAGEWHQERVTTQLANEAFKHFHVLPKYGGQLGSPPGVSTRHQCM